MRFKQKQYLQKYSFSIISKFRSGKFKCIKFIGRRVCLDGIPEESTSNKQPSKGTFIVLIQKFFIHF